MDLLYFFQTFIAVFLTGILGSRKTQGIFLVTLPKGLNLLLFLRAKQKETMIEFVIFQAWIYVISAIYLFLILTNRAIVWDYTKICLVSLILLFAFGITDNILYYIKSKKNYNDVIASHKFFDIIIKADKSLVVQTVTPYKDDLFSPKIFFRIERPSPYTGKDLEDIINLLSEKNPASIENSGVIKVTSRVVGLKLKNVSHSLIVINENELRIDKEINVGSRKSDFREEDSVILEDFKNENWGEIILESVQKPEDL